MLHYLFVQALNDISLRQNIGVLYPIGINIKDRMVDISEIRLQKWRQTVEREEIPPTGHRIWLSPR